jgi:hypothetical protein
VDQLGKEPVNSHILHYEAFPTVFKRCTGCGKEWIGDEEFLSDRDVYLDGRQANAMRWFVDLKERGILLFDHNAIRCGSKLVLAAEMFHQHDVERHRGRT